MGRYTQSSGESYSERFRNSQKKYILSNSINDYGKMFRMKQTISWKDKYGNVHTVPYYIANKGTGSQDNNDVVPLSTNLKQIWIQDNEENRSIYENQRFVLKNMSLYKVTARDNATLDGVIKLTLESTQMLKEDDLINNIAYNKQEQADDSELKDGVFFTINGEPINSLEIPIGLSKVVEVYKYDSLGNKLSNTYSFSINDINSQNYEIVNLEDNLIEIKCLAYYYVGDLVAIDNSDLSENKIKITLKSLF